jgi:hypothetical protein
VGSITLCLTRFLCGAPESGSRSAHGAGFALRKDDPVPQFYTDSLQVWAATGPDLKEVLKRDGEAILCPELGTRYPAAA